MAIIEFEGFDKKTEKALKKKVAEVVAKKPALTKDEALEELARVCIDGADVVEHAGALHFFANDQGGYTEWRCFAELDEGLVTSWSVVGRDLPPFDTLDALLKAL